MSIGDTDDWKGGEDTDYFSEPNDAVEESIRFTATNPLEKSVDEGRALDAQLELSKNKQNKKAQPMRSKQRSIRENSGNQTTSIKEAEMEPGSMKRNFNYFIAGSTLVAIPLSYIAYQIYQNY
jgi:hypothetical protein